MQAIGKLIRVKQQKNKKSSQYKVHIDHKVILKQLQTPQVRKGQEKSTITQKQFITLCRKMKKILLSQPCLLRLSGPIIIATGCLGYYQEQTNIIRRCGSPRRFNYLLLGDYSGRGNGNIQTLAYLFCWKIQMKNNFFLLRGCYQTIAMARSSTLYQQVVQRFSPRAWAQVTQVFCSLPFAAIVDQQIFCVHGGISPQIRSIQQINKVTRPMDTPQSGMLCDLIWSDPAYKSPSKNQNHQNYYSHHRNNYPAFCPPEYQQSQRGFGFTFTPQAVQNFLYQFRLQMVCRGHQVIYDGFQVSYNRKLATICSHQNYCGIYNNSAAVMNVDDEVNVFFRIVQQKLYFPNVVDEEEHPESRLRRIAREKWKIKKQAQALKKKTQKALREQLQGKKQQQQKRLAQLQAQEQDYQSSSFSSSEQMIKQKKEQVIKQQSSNQYIQKEENQDFQQEQQERQKQNKSVKIQQIYKQKQIKLKQKEQQKQSKKQLIQEQEKMKIEENQKKKQEYQQNQKFKLKIQKISEDLKDQKQQKIDIQQKNQGKKVVRFKQSSYMQEQEQQNRKSSIRFEYQERPIQNSEQYSQDDDKL